MNNPQRILIFVFLLLSAVAMHFWHCVWLLGSSRYPNILMVTWWSGDYGIEYLGIAERGSLVHRNVTLFGLVTPAVLLFIDLFLWLGWRHHFKKEPRKKPSSEDANNTQEF